MNLDKLFEVQRGLDAEIEKNHPTAPGEDRLAKRILALQVELGELCQEWRGFKFWSVNQKPKPNKDVYDEKTDTFREVNPLLEEYVDCLHFILSIGNDIHVKNIKPAKLISFGANITGQFNALFRLISHCDTVMLLIDDAPYRVIFNNFLHLGEMLGFTWEQIETAYLEKNKINYQRQNKGY